VANGGLSIGDAVEQLAKLTASIPGQHVTLPAPEGRAYRGHFARAVKRRLILTGFTGIDDAIAGLMLGDYLGLAARSNIGKTAFLLALARAQLFPFAAGNYLVDGSSMEARLAAHTDRATATDVLLLSLEMTAQGVRERLMLDMLDVNGKTWRANPDAALADSALACKIGIDGYLDAFDSAAATLTIVDAAALGGRASASAVDSTITTWAAERRAVNPDAALLVLVDYWQNIEASGDDKATKQQQLGDTSKVLARAAKRERVALVCAAQIGRAVDNHEPNESELRESGDLLIDADIVMLLHGASPAQRDRLDTASVVFGAFETEAKSTQRKLKSTKAANTEANQPNDLALARDTLLVIGGKGRDVAAGWRVPLYFQREYQRLTDGWSDVNGNGYRNPFASKDVTGVLKS
jgi:replicative DNA helicase